MTYNVETIIKYRLSRADESIIEAKLLAVDNHWNTVANRLYYACFYSVIALLHKKGITTKSHSGARIQLNKEFVKTNILDIKYA